MPDLTTWGVVYTVIVVILGIGAGVGFMSPENKWMGVLLLEVQMVIAVMVGTVFLRETQNWLPAVGALLVVTAESVYCHWKWEFHNSRKNLTYNLAVVVVLGLICGFHSYC